MNKGAARFDREQHFAPLVSQTARDGRANDALLNEQLRTPMKSCMRERACERRVSRVELSQSPALGSHAVSHAHSRALAHAHLSYAHLSYAHTRLQRALTAGVFEELSQRVKELTGMITDKPGHDQIEVMIAELEKTLKATMGDSRTIQIILENLKSDLRRKVTKSDVLNLVNASVDEIKGSMHAPDDTMMIGSIPYRCLSCNQSLTGMHKTKAKNVNHKSMSLVPSTLAPDTGRYLVENGGGLREGVAVGGSGRMGALKPLGVGSSPGVPRVSVGIGLRRSSGSGKLTKGSTIGRPGTAPNLLS